MSRAIFHYLKCGLSLTLSRQTHNNLRCSTTSPRNSTFHLCTAVRANICAYLQLFFVLLPRCSAGTFLGECVNNPPFVITASGTSNRLNGLSRTAQRLRWSNSGYFSDINWRLSLFYSVPYTSAIHVRHEQTSAPLGRPCILFTSFLFEQSRSNLFKYTQDRISPPFLGVCRLCDDNGSKYGLGMGSTGFCCSRSRHLVKPYNLSSCLPKQTLRKGLERYRMAEQDWPSLLC